MPITAGSYRIIARPSRSPFVFGLLFTSPFACPRGLRSEATCSLSYHAPEHLATSKHVYLLQYITDSDNHSLSLLGSCEILSQGDRPALACSTYMSSNTYPFLQPVASKEQC